MRVISGSLKGRTLFAPKGRGIRPTSDQVKETLFNMIGPRIVHALFLDLFAGTGNVGIEALSRDAEQVVFVEKNPLYVRILKRNLTGCTVESKSRVYCGDVNKIVKVLQKENWHFSMIFLDPPYRQTNLLRDILQLLVTLSLVAEEGLVIAEHTHTFAPPSAVGERLFLTKQRRMGDTTLTFYETK
jgi:16S rRNA (guanine966-N2)-methyltransferase